MWTAAQAVGVKRFSSVTGIDLSKNTPESIRKNHQGRNTVLASDIFNDAPEGADYPHNYEFFKYEITDPEANATIHSIISSPFIANRNILAMQTVQSETFRGQVNKALGDYREAMGSFKSLSGERFDIQNWEDLPKEEDDWKILAQRWAIQQYQLMQRRYDAIQKIVDPKANADWEALATDLGIK
jgi:hypothetical protein